MTSLATCAALSVFNRSASDMAVAAGAEVVVDVVVGPLIAVLNTLSTVTENESMYILAVNERAVNTKFVDFAPSHSVGRRSRSEGYWVIVAELEEEYDFNNFHGAAATLDVDGVHWK